MNLKEYFEINYYNENGIINTLKIEKKKLHSIFEVKTEYTERSCSKDITSSIK